MDITLHMLLIITNWVSCDFVLWTLIQMNNFTLLAKYKCHYELFSNSILFLKINSFIPNSTFYYVGICWRLFIFILFEFDRICCAFSLLFFIFNLVWGGFFKILPSSCYEYIFTKNFVSYCFIDADWSKFRNSILLMKKIFLISYYSDQNKSYNRIDDLPFG